ncbi:MAG: hypothetical protein DRJ35_00280 [Thermoprotei archaeon]|nr:MAG: hypothetical protein DRJ35_00280 [Thermoprotei archaeon]
MSENSDWREVTINAFLRVLLNEVSVENVDKQGFLVYLKIAWDKLVLKARKIRIVGIIEEIEFFRNGFRFTVSDGSDKVVVRGWREHMGLVEDLDLNEGDVVEVFGYVKVSYENEIYIVPFIIVKHEDPSFMVEWAKRVEEDRMHLLRIVNA